MKKMVKRVLKHIAIWYLVFFASMLLEWGAWQLGWVGSVDTGLLVEWAIFIWYSCKLWVWMHRNKAEGVKKHIAIWNLLFIALVFLFGIAWQLGLGGIAIGSMPLVLMAIFIGWLFLSGVGDGRKLLRWLNNTARGGKEQCSGGTDAK
jgi:hypothetical protein